MQNPIEEIEEALEVLSLPNFISKEDIKKQYHFLAKKYHPDVGGKEEKMEKINSSYKILIEYIETFRYSFDKEEIKKQSLGVMYDNQFKP